MNFGNFFDFMSFGFEIWVFFRICECSISFFHFYVFEYECVCQNGKFGNDWFKLQLKISGRPISEVKLFPAHFTTEVGDHLMMMGAIIFQKKFFFVLFVFCF